MWGDIAIAFLLAFITAFVVTPHTMRLAKKVGAIDIPNDRRVNKKPMPRLRWTGRYIRFFSFGSVFINYNYCRRKDRPVWRRKLHYEFSRLFTGYFYFRICLLY